MLTEHRKKMYLVELQIIHMTSTAQLRSVPLLSYIIKGSLLAEMSIKISRIHVGLFL